MRLANLASSFSALVDPIPLSYKDSRYFRQLPPIAYFGRLQISEGGGGGSHYSLLDQMRTKCGPIPFNSGKSFLTCREEKDLLEKQSNTFTLQFG